MVNRFEGLGHHAVVGRDDEHDDIGHFCAAGTHTSKRLMTGSVDEYNLAAILFDVISTDVLRDTTGFAAGHVGLANSVEQRCFFRGRRDP